MFNYKLTEWFSSELYHIAPLLFYSLLSVFSRKKLLSSKSSNIYHTVLVYVISCYQMLNRIVISSSKSYHLIILRVLWIVIRYCPLNCTHYNALNISYYCYHFHYNIILWILSCHRDRITSYTLNFYLYLLWYLSFGIFRSIFCVLHDSKIL